MEFSDGYNCYLVIFSPFKWLTKFSLIPQLCFDDFNDLALRKVHFRSEATLENKSTT